MVIKTYFDKNNTIVSSSSVNTGLNPIAELFYGGPVGEEVYSRFLFYFDTTRLQTLYSSGTFTDLTKLTHTLKLTNTGSLDESLLNGTMDGLARTSSFDLIVFTINQPWDNGVGYDYNPYNYINTPASYSILPSNWQYAQTAQPWSGGTGVYSGSPSGITVSTQHFDLGNENICMDITSYVNGVLTGNTNYGLGLAFTPAFEMTSTSVLQYVGFFTHHTQTFYEPYVETVYSNYIKDDRNDFYLDKPNNLYLYVNIAGNPTNLDFNPTVTVYDQNGSIFSSYTQSAVTHVTLGVYSIPIIVPTNATNDCTMYTDTWSGITISGVTRPAITLNIPVKDSLGYYNIGDNDMLPKKIGVTISGIRNNENIKRGDVRKVIVSARIPYTVEQSQSISGLQYRLYVKEGNNQLTVIDFQPVEMANNHYYFLIDTNSLIPNTYYVDVLASSNQEVTTLANVVQFNIVNQVESRQSQ